jgi:hypothetical protein
MHPHEHRRSAIVHNQAQSAVEVASRGHGARLASATESIATTGIRAGRRVIERARTRPKSRSPLAVPAAAGRSGCRPDVGRRSVAVTAKSAYMFHNLNYPNRLNDVRNAPHPCNRTSTRQKAVQRRSALGCLGPSDAAKPGVRHAAPRSRAQGRHPCRGGRNRVAFGLRRLSEQHRLQNPAGWVSRIFPAKLLRGRP